MHMQSCCSWWLILHMMYSSYKRITFQPVLVKLDCKWCHSLHGLVGKCHVHVNLPLTPTKCPWKTNSVKSERSKSNFFTQMLSIQCQIKSWVVQKADNAVRQVREHLSTEWIFIRYMALSVLKNYFPKYYDTIVVRDCAVCCRQQQVFCLDPPCFLNFCHGLNYDLN